MPQFPVKLAFYKPNRDNNGAAVQFDLAVDKQAVFIEAAPQAGGQAFDWNNKIVMKLDVTDVGKLLSVLNGAATQAKLYHDPAKREGYAGQARNNTIDFSRGGQYGYAVRVSQQTTDKNVRSVLIMLSDDEAQVLRVLLEKAVERFYNW